MAKLFETKWNFAHCLADVDGKQRTTKAENYAPTTCFYADDHIIGHIEN